MKMEEVKAEADDFSPSSENVDSEVVEPSAVMEPNEEPETPADSGAFIQETM